jgi:hypothetical protein
MERSAARVARRRGFIARSLSEVSASYGVIDNRSENLQHCQWCMRVVQDQPQPMSADRNAPAAALQMGDSLTPATASQAGRAQIELPDHRPRRPAPGLAKRTGERPREARFFVGAQKACDREPAAMRDEE